MSTNFDIPTRASMFLRLQENEEQAWIDFVKLYGPMIAAWCLRNSLDETEAADVTQIVLVKLVNSMRESKYDPSKGSFRSWLKCVTNNAVRDVMRSWKRAGNSHGDLQSNEQLQLLEDPRAFEDLNRCVDAEYEHMLLREAERCVRKRVQDSTWRAFEMTAINEMSPKEASSALDMTVAEVYVAKCRVTKMLREEVTRQESEEFSE